MAETAEDYGIQIGRWATAVLADVIAERDDLRAEVKLLKAERDLNEARLAKAGAKLGRAPYAVPDPDSAA